MVPRGPGATPATFVEEPTSAVQDATPEEVVEEPTSEVQDAAPPEPAPATEASDEAQNAVVATEASAEAEPDAQ